MGARRAWLVLLLTAGCSETRWLPAPPLDPAVRAVVFSFVAEDGPRVFATEPPLGRLEILANAGTAVEVGLFEQPLEVLQIEPGEGRAKRGERLLPEPDRILVADVAQLRAGWSAGTGDSLRQVFLPPFERNRCLRTGRCILNEGPSCVACPERAPIAPPELPQPVCPTGWLRTSTTSPELCAPSWPRKLTCDPLSYQSARSERCVPVGDVCPGGRFPPALAGRGAWYVDPKGPAGGDGSIAAPFSRLSDAIDAAGPGDQLLLSAGELAGPISLSRDVVLRGACPSATILSVVGALVVNSASVAISGVQIRSDWPVRLRSGSLALDGVVIAEGTGRGSEAFGGVLSVRRSLIRDRGAEGVAIGEQARGVIEQVEVRGSPFTAVGCYGGDAMIRDLHTSHVPGGECTAPSVHATAGCQLSARELLVEEYCYHGVHANDPITLIELEDVMVRDVREPLGGEGRGVVAFGHSTIHAKRLAVERVEKGGLHAVESSIEAEDVRIDSVVGNDDFPWAIFMENSPSVRLERVSITRCHIGSAIDAQEVFLRDISMRDVGGLSGALYISAPLADVARLQIVNSNGALGLYANIDTGPMEDVTLIDTAGIQLPSTRGRVVRRVRIQGVERTGALVTTMLCALGACPRFRLEDVEIRGSNPIDEGSAGIELRGTELDIERFSIEDVGLGFDASGASLGLANGVIRRARVGVLLAPNAPDLEALGASVLFEAVDDPIVTR